MDVNKRSSMTHTHTTYAHQERLPKLPLPDLEATLDKFLQFTSPLQTAEEHR